MIWFIHAAHVPRCRMQACPPHSCNTSLPLVPFSSCVCAAFLPSLHVWPPFYLHYCILPVVISHMALPILTSFPILYVCAMCLHVCASSSFMSSNLTIVTFYVYLPTYLCALPCHLVCMFYLHCISILCACIHALLYINMLPHTCCMPSCYITM